MTKNSAITSVQEVDSREEELPYSIYTTPEKYVIIIATSLTAFFSTASAPVYLPILPLLEKQFHSTEEGMNISVMMYSIFQGLTPSLFSNLADRYGRRVMIISCFFFYVSANIGLALNNTYGGLLCLRSLQAFGISSTVSIASGVVGDVSVKRERGHFMGVYTCVGNMGQALGALIGAATEQSFGWRGIYWMLTIVSSCVIILFFLVVPETNRSKVGNGSSFPETLKAVSMCPALKLPCINRGRISNNFNPTIEKEKPFDPIAPFRIVSRLDMALVVLPSAISYSLWLMGLTTLSLSLQKTYGWTSPINVGLAYIPAGVGGMMGPIVVGRLLDYSYKKHHKRFVAENENYGEEKDFREFDVLRSRLEVFVGPLLLGCLGGLLFGWSITKKLTVVAVLVGSGITSFGWMAFTTVATTILVDSNPGNTSAAAAGLNLARCLTDAVGLSVLSPMSHKMTVGGSYTFIIGVTLLSSVPLVYVYSRSRHFMQNRLETL